MTQKYTPPPPILRNIDNFPHSSPLPHKHTHTHTHTHTTHTHTPYK